MGLFGRRKPPAAARPKLDKGERVVAWAATAEGGASAVVVALQVDPSAPPVGIQVTGTEKSRSVAVPGSVCVTPFSWSVSRRRVTIVMSAPAGFGS